MTVGIKTNRPRTHRQKVALTMVGVAWENKQCKSGAIREIALLENLARSPSERISGSGNKNHRITPCSVIKPISWHPVSRSQFNR